LGEQCLAGSATSWGRWIKADEFKFTNVLTARQRFIVPLYQRQYQWHDDRDGGRTAAFWRDVAAKAMAPTYPKAEVEAMSTAIMRI